MFKVGDKVRIINTDSAFCFDEGVIIEVNEDLDIIYQWTYQYKVRVELDGFVYETPYMDLELELIRD